MRYHAVKGYSELTWRLYLLIEKMKGKMRKTGSYGVANKHTSLLIPADHKNLQEFVFN